MAEQLVFKRTEMKYILTHEQYLRLLEIMKEHMIADVHGVSTIQSLYYDTDSYLLIRRSMEHPIYKEKVRARSYGLANEDSKVFLELKKKYDSVVYKRRMELKEGELRKLPGEGKWPETQIGKEIAYCFDFYKGLKPSILLIYDREAYYDKNDHEFRMTFDQNIRWRNYDLNLSAGIYGKELYLGANNHEYHLLEVKSGGAMTKWLVDFLSKEHIYRTGFSKYANAYQALLREQYEIKQNYQKNIKNIAM